MNKLLGLAVLFALATFAPSSAAALPDEGSNVTDTVVETVTTTVEGAIPDPPAVEPPPVSVAPPSVPAETAADPPSLPAVPTAAVPDPVSKLPQSVSKVVEGTTPHAAVGAIAGGAPDTPSAAPGPVNEADRPLPGASDASAGQSPRGEVQPAEDSGNSTVETPKFAPVSWFLANVWPAVALQRGGGPGSVLSGITLPSTAEAAPLARIVGDLVPGLNESRPVSADLTPPESAAASDRASTPPWDSALSSGARVALYIAIAALLALLAYLVRTEFSSVPGRPGHR
jgi:hypothetical protein